MPCRDYYDDHPEAYYGPKLKDKDAQIAALQRQVAFAESALCAALNALEHVDSLVTTTQPKIGTYYRWLNLAEAGITETDLVVWHAKHRALDEAHREEERKRRVKEAALAKLSPEERALLGLPPKIGN